MTHITFALSHLKYKISLKLALAYKVNLTVSDKEKKLITPMVKDKRFHRITIVIQVVKVGDHKRSLIRQSCFRHR